VFEAAEGAFFEHFDPLLPEGGKPRGEVILEPLFGTRPGPPIYLTHMMTQAGRDAYGRRLSTLVPLLHKLEPRVRSRARVRRIVRCIEGVQADIARAGSGQ
jgi:hypothetical protein